MGGACSRKRGGVVDEDGGDPPRRWAAGNYYSQSGSSKWLLLSLPRCGSDVARGGQGKCPSLMDLCVARVCQDISKHGSFSALPRDLSQQIFNELVESRCLTDASIGAFRNCALQDIHLCEYPGVKDSWVGVICSQGQSLLSLDISCSDVTDSGLILLRDCPNLQNLTFNYCDQISVDGVKNISRVISLLYLNLSRCRLSDDGCEKFAGLGKLKILNLGFNNITNACLVHLKDLIYLESLNLDSCKIQDEGLYNLRGIFFGTFTDNFN